MTQALLLALAPIAVLIALGAWCRRRRFLGDAFWPHAEKLGYYLLLPALFLHGLATARLDGVPIWPMVTVLMLATLTVAALLIAVRSRLPVDGPGFTSVFQGGVRFNNYVGVSAIAGLLGAQGVALAAVANAAIVPTVNVLCVLVFARHGSQRQPSILSIIRLVATNPLVIACVLGIALNATGIGLAPVAEPVIKALGQAALPLGLLCVGAAIEFRSVQAGMKPIAAASIAKFVLLPMATLGACRLVGLEGAAAMTALLFQCLPTSSASYILARKLGGDAPLMAGIVAAQTMMAGVLMPLLLPLLLRFLL